MNLFGLSGVLTAVAMIFNGSLALYQKPRERVNQVFFIFSLTVAIWGIGAYKIALTGYEEDARFWWNFAHLGITLIPPTLFHFIVLFLGEKKSRFLFFAYSFGAIFISILLFDIFTNSRTIIRELGFLFNSFYWDIHYTFDLYWPFVFFWFLIVIYAHFKLLVGYRKVGGLKRQQIKYFLLAILVGFSGGGTAFLPCFGINIYPILNFGIPIGSIILTYGFLRYRLMNIRVALGKTFVYSLAFISIFLILLLSLRFLAFLGVPWQKESIFFVFILIAPLLFQFLSKRYEKIVTALFYYPVYFNPEFFQDLTQRFLSLLDLKSIVDSILEMVKVIFKTEKAIVLIKRGGEKIVYEPVGAIGDLKDLIPFLERTNVLAYLFEEKTRDSILVEEIPLIMERIFIAKEKNEVEEFYRQLDSHNISFIFSLIFKEEILGFILLGPKYFTETYTVEDIDFLKRLSYPITIAIQNAIFLEELKRDKEILEKFYKLGAQRELKMLQLKEEIKKLKEEVERLKKKYGANNLQK